jgi:hypothetical protein
MGMIWDYEYTIEPAFPNGSEEVRVRIDYPQGCFNASASAVADVPGRQLEFKIYGWDYGYEQCPPAQVPPIYRSFGVLPRGTYSLQLSGCNDNPFPGYPVCQVVETIQLVVGGGDPVPVPTIGLIGIGALIFAALVLARRRFVER